MSPVTPREARTALIQLLVAEVLIGSVGVFVRESGQAPVTAVFFRCVFGSLFLLGWGMARGYLRGLWSDRDLVRTAVGVGPKELKDTAELRLFLLDQDGPAPDDAERARKRGVSVAQFGSI